MLFGQELKTKTKWVLSDVIKFVIALSKYFVNVIGMIRGSYLSY